MSFSAEITTLAITKMYGGVCTAGIDEAGRWVRPVRHSSEQAPRGTGAGDYSLLPIDFFYQGKHWPLVVGVHSIPELEVEIDFARL